MKLKGVDGWYRSVDGAENAPDDANWDAGMRTEGARFFETTSVAFSVVEPVGSLAVKPIGTPVIVSVPTSSVEGVPDRIRELLSSESQLGPLESVYVMGRVDENVGLGKAYENGVETRAAGGI